MHISVFVNAQSSYTGQALYIVMKPVELFQGGFSAGPSYGLRERCEQECEPNASCAVMHPLRMAAFAFAVILQ